MPSVSVTAEASTRGCAAIARVGFSSSHSGGIDAVGAGALQRDRAAGFGPLRPRVLLERRIVAHPRLHGGDLIGDRLVDQRLDLRRHVDARAGDGEAGVAEIHLRREIRLDAPGGGESSAAR